MIFTDEDSKRLKEAMDTPSLRACRAFGVPDLLARLEAAENALQRFRFVPVEYRTEGMNEALEVWKKAAGK